MSASEPMKQATLCFCVDGDRVLLAMKKRGFGAGKWNGYGGKVEPGETPRDAATRELREESGLSVQAAALEQAAVVSFFFAGRPLFECHVFLARAWDGEPVETDEMRPSWFATGGLPFDAMWAADARWLPRVLGGERLRAVIDFDETGSEVRAFRSEPATFP